MNRIKIKSKTLDRGSTAYRDDGSETLDRGFKPAAMTTLS